MELGQAPAAGGDGVGGVPPYRPGDRIRLQLDGEVVEATVGIVIPTDSLDPSRRWRILYRLPDATVSDVAAHCGDDGTGELVRPVDDHVG